MSVLLFRGTTEGFPGNPVLQKLGIIPAQSIRWLQLFLVLKERIKEIQFLPLDLEQVLTVAK